MSADRGGESREKAVASTGHTVGLLLGLIVVSVSGAMTSPITEWPETLATPRARLLLYSKIIILQWAWLFYVTVGLRRSASSVRALIDNSSLNAFRWLRYLAVALAALLFWSIAGAGLSAVLRPTPEELRGLLAMLPKAPRESALWVLFSFSAGVCEELVYRGYLMRQLRAWSGGAVAALLLQALTYAIAHLSLPVEMVVSVGLLGLLLGGLAIWQKSLLPGMIMHVGIGLVAAIPAGRPA